MENEIKVNDFVRLQNGVIGTVTEIKTVSTNMRGEHAYAYKLGKTKKYNSCWVEDYAIVKHSRNLIDILEIGDFIHTDYGWGWYRHKVGENTIVIDGGDEFIDVNKDEIHRILTQEIMLDKSYEV